MNSTSTIRILLDDTEVTVTSSPIIAATAYRALLRRSDLRAQRPLAVYEVDGRVIHSHPVDGRAESVAETLPLPSATTNDVFKALRGGIDEQDLRDALHDIGYPVSGSQLQGWTASETNRRYRKITLDELYVVAYALGSLDRRHEDV